MLFIHNIPTCVHMNSHTKYTTLSPLQNKTTKTHVSCGLLFSKTISRKKNTFSSCKGKEAPKSFLSQVSVEQTESHMVLRDGKGVCAWLCFQPAFPRLSLPGCAWETISGCVFMALTMALNLKNWVLLSVPSPFSSRRNWTVLQKVKWKGFFYQQALEKLPKKGKLNLSGSSVRDATNWTLTLKMGTE